MAEQGACLRQLIWATGRVGGAEDKLIELATWRPSDRRALPLRRAALEALGNADSPGKASIEHFEATVQSDDAPSRQLAAEVLARWAPKRARALAEELISDRPAFERLSAHVDVGDVVRQGSRAVHLQGVALPKLVALGDLDGLAAVADDGDLSDTVRLGAIEAIARLETEAGETKLKQYGADEALDDELRKAAWRGVRRSRRARLT